MPFTDGWKGATPVKKALCRELYRVASPHVAFVPPKAKPARKATRTQEGRHGVPRLLVFFLFFVALLKNGYDLGLLKTAKRALLKELMKATGWLGSRHSVRGFLSGTTPKKNGHSVESFKSPDGQRAHTASVPN